MTDDEKLSRFHDLRKWMLVLDCCPQCAMGIALAIVEREAGGAFEQTHVCGRSYDCRAEVRRLWRERPGLGAPSGPVVSFGSPAPDGARSAAAQVAGDTSVSIARTIALTVAGGVDATAVHVGDRNGTPATTGCSRPRGSGAREQTYGAVRALAQQCDPTGHAA